MPNPIITDRWRAQVVIPGRSGLPEDVYVNTFGFRNDGIATRDQMADAIRDRLSDFYVTPVAQTGMAISNFLNGAMFLNTAAVKVYDLGEAPPRRVIERTITLTATSGDPLPTEVAATLSFYGDRNLPRQRGRIYLGPLKTTVLGTQANTVLFASNFLITAAHAMRRLSQQATGNVARWHVISGTAADSVQVSAGWVDDSPDTQRRRGRRASVRTKWDEAGVLDDPQT